MSKIQQWQLDRISQADATNKELSTELGLGEDTITKHSRLLGVILPKGKKPLNTNVDHATFAVWQPNMAYLLGFLAADGCIRIDSHGAKVIKISIGEKDEMFLHQIAGLFKFKLPVQKYVWPRNGQVSFNISVYSPIIFDRLMELGITPRKSLTLQWMPDTPDALLSHFARGYHDGDGSVSVDNREGRHGLRFRFAGTQNFLAGLKAGYTRVTGDDSGSLYPHSQKPNCWVLEYHGKKSALAFASWMYQDSTPQTRLDRKYQIYKSVL
jgi:hypothetical protein